MSDNPRPQSENPKLHSVETIAQFLNVPVTWIYKQTRLKGQDAIPVIRLGKYCRFEEEAVVEWYRRKYSTPRGI